MVSPVSIVGLMIGSATSYACSCAESRSAQIELQEKTAVFSGKAVSVHKPFTLFNSSSADLVEVTFKIYRVWKGDLEQKATVHTAMASASCGFNFEQNHDYLVYAIGDPTDLEANLCSRTQALQSSAQDIDDLGPPLMSPIDDKAGDNPTIK